MNNEIIKLHRQITLLYKKIQSEVDALINDATDSEDSTYSSEKIEGIAGTYISVTDNYTLLSSYNAGDKIIVKNNSTSAVTITGTMDGQSSQVLSPEEALFLHFNGTDWDII